MAKFVIARFQGPGETTYLASSLADDYPFGVWTKRPLDALRLHTAGISRRIAANLAERHAAQTARDHVAREAPRYRLSTAPAELPSARYRACLLPCAVHEPGERPVGEPGGDTSGGGTPIVI